jgi:hypothetical protein
VSASVYETPPETFAELIAPFPQPIRETAEWLRALMLEAFPQLDENIYGGAKVANALYSIGSTTSVALGIQPGPKAVKLFIHDPEHLGKTSFELEGRGRHMRHIKLAAPPVERRDELLSLMRIPVERRS